MTKLEYLLKQHDELMGWYKQSEEKAKFVVTLNTFVAAVVNGLVFVGGDKVKAARLYTIPVWILLALSGLALVCSFLFVLRAMWPRHHWRGASLGANEQLWFFGHLASMSRDEHRKVVEQWREQDFEATMAAENHVLSASVWVKHESLIGAIVLTITAIVLFFVLGVVYGFTLAQGAPQPAAGGG